LQPSTPVMLTQTTPLSPTQPRLRSLVPSRPHLPPTAQASHEGRERQAEHQRTSGFFFCAEIPTLQVYTAALQRIRSGRRVQYFWGTGRGRLPANLMQASVASGDAFPIEKCDFIYLLHSDGHSGQNGKTGWQKRRSTHGWRKQLFFRDTGVPR